MKAQKEIHVMGLLLGIVLSITPQGWAQPNPEANGPTIIHAFAVDRGYYGCIWKIYLEAEDPTGQMLKIACSVDQAGYGRYLTDWIYLKPQFQKTFKGYIQWNTFSSKIAPLLDGTQIFLKISIVDKAGNESKELVFPLTFKSGKGVQASLPAPFDRGDIPRLGYVSIELEEPILMPQA